MSVFCWSEKKGTTSDKSVWMTWGGNSHITSACMTWRRITLFEHRRYSEQEDNSGFASVHDVKRQLPHEIQACGSRPFTSCTLKSPELSPFPLTCSCKAWGQLWANTVGREYSPGKQAEDSKVWVRGGGGGVKPVLLKKVSTAWRGHYFHTVGIKQEYFQ